MVSATPSDTHPKTILLRGNTTPHSERPAGAAITPGMLLNVNSAGEFIPHGSAAGLAEPLFAREPSMIGGSIDTVYAVGDVVHAWHCRNGDQVYAFLEEEATIDIGDLLESGGAGSLQEGSTNPIARALEAVNTQNVSGPVRIKVEIIR